MNDEDTRYFCQTASNGRNAWATDACTNRLAAHVRREVEAIKMNVIREAMAKPYASGLLEDKVLLDYYTKVADLLDTENHTLEVIGDMYTIYAFIKALQNRLSAMLPHFYRVSELCIHMGKMMGFAQHDLSVIGALGVLHDVGKLGISNAILFKQSALTAIEWKDIRRHPAIGYKLIHPIVGISDLADLILAHHERWDGKGYPQGLKGEEIPLFSRILTLADSIDAMISDRSYRKALLPSQIVMEIDRCSGSQFDPVVVEAFFDMVREGSYTLPFLSSLHDAVEGYGRSALGHDHPDSLGDIV